MQVSTKRFIALAILLIVCLTVYGSRSSTFPQTKSTEVTFANAGVLKDWVPDGVYRSALEHINYYLATSGVRDKLVTITNTPYYNDDGSLSFDFATNLTSDPNTVVIRTQDYGDGLLSNAVTINDESSTYTATDRLYDANFSGFDELLSGDTSLSGIQVYEIQKGLVRFNENARFSIETESIKERLTTQNTRTIFNVLINGDRYRLENSSSDITSTHFVLYNSKDKKVFDSGTIKLSD